MNRWWSRVAAALLVLAVVVAAGVTLAWNALPLDGTTVWIDGESFSLADLSAGHAVAVFAIALVVTLAALVLAALAVVIGLAAAALGIAVGVLATAASLLLVASPFLLVGWLLWRLLRKPASNAPAAAA
jgi:hypothetical protein